MSMTIFKGILIPFLGTSLGAACVLFMKKNLHYLVQRALTGFAAGVMVAAGVWSLLIPSMEQSAKMGRLRFVPAATLTRQITQANLFGNLTAKNTRKNMIAVAR